jgi:hypothetical protein
VGGVKRLFIVLAAAATLTVAPAYAAYADTALPAPGKPVVSNLTATGATLTWAPSQGPVFRYSMQRLVDGAWQGFVSMPSTTVTLSDLAAGEYTVAVQSHALVGSGYTSSPLSEPVTFTIGAAPPSCRLDFWTWQGGYTADGTHTGRLVFTMPTGMAVTYSWNTQLIASGSQVTLTANGRFGFGGTTTGTFVLPTGLTPTCVVTINGRIAATDTAQTG